MLRAAFIMCALDAGVPLREVQIAARHADPERPPCTTTGGRTSTSTRRTSSSPSWRVGEAGRSLAEWTTTAPREVPGSSAHQGSAARASLGGMVLRGRRWAREIVE
jgi:hypothetical protein